MQATLTGGDSDAATLRPVEAVARPVPIIDASATMAYEATSLPQRRKRRASAPLAVGERYELGAPIGRGGMGEVLSAYDAQIGREVAIKRLQPDRTTPGALARFLREARIQGRLDHPAIPPVYELADDDHGNPFFAMKKLSGVTLSEILHSPEVRERFPLQRLLRAFVEICLAIEFAHSRGIIHRDLKPSNMLLGEFGEVYVLDWGVARVLDETDPREADGPHFGEVTVAGTTLGTPGYMSPEQVRGERDLDARADVYALGCVLYEIVSGRRLHPPGLAGMKSALVDRPARPSTYRDDIAPELDELCRLATTYERHARIPSARALGEAVQRYLDGDRDLERRRALAGMHLSEARAAWTGTSDEEVRRRVVMREAGRALALEPTLEAAAELVQRVMLAPPQATPREVIEELDELDAREGDKQSRLAMKLYGGYIALVPLLWLLGFRSVGYLSAFACVAAGNIALRRDLLRHRRPWHKLGVATGNAALIALLARMFTPFLIAPGVCAVTVMAFAFHPTSQRRQVWISTVMGAGAVIGVWLAEAIGLLSPTIIVHPGGGLILHSPVAGHPTPAVPALCFFTIAIVAAASGLAYAVTHRAREVRRRLHVQSWQLRQLLSVSADGEPSTEPL